MENTGEHYKFSNKVREKSLVSLSVYNVGHQRCTPGYTWGPGMRDHYLIHYVISGKGTYTVHGRTHELYPGDAFLIFPDTEVSYRADLHDPWEYRWVGFQGSDAASIIGSSDFTPAGPVLHHISCGDALCEHLTRINKAYGNSFSNAIEMTGELYLCLNLLITKSPESESDDPATVRRALSYIDARYSYAITVEDVAGYAAVSRSTLYRQFMKTIGISPKQYLDELRMRRACRLLEDTDLTVSAISVSVGIPNSLYFSRAFHKATGLTPTAYRAGKRNPS